MPATAQRQPYQPIYAEMRGMAAIKRLRDLSEVPLHSLNPQITLSLAEAIHGRPTLDKRNLAFKAARQDAIAAERRRLIKKRDRRVRRAFREPTREERSWIAYHRLQARLTSERITEGFKFGPGHSAPKGSVMQRTVHFIEKGFRSRTAESPSMEYFPSLLPLHLTVGDDKGDTTMGVQTWQQVL